MKFPLLISVLLLSLSAWSKEQLIPKNAELLQVDEVDFAPTYFFRSDANGRWIGFNDSESRGRIYDFLGRKEYSIGPQDQLVWDPVFVEDRDIVVLAVNENGLIFYDTSKIDSQGPIQFFQDADMRGLYHSIGVIESKPDFLKMRLVYQSFRNMKFHIRDYELMKVHDQWVMTVTHTKYAACGEKNFSMAIMSRSSEEIMVSDIQAQKSAIYRIEPEGECTLIGEFNQFFGKGSFSYDGRWIAFHEVNASQYDEDGYLKTPTPGSQGNILLFDRHKKEILPLTRYVNSTALYPDFLKDGTILYVVYPADGKKVRYVRVRPK